MIGLYVKFKAGIDPAKFQRRVEKGVYMAMIDLLEDAKTASRREYFYHDGGPVKPDKLTSRHGGASLLDTVGYDIKKRGSTVIGRFGADSPYARIHERGGVIRAKAAEYLKFIVPGVGWRQVKQVTMPARPFLEPAVEGVLPKAQEIFRRSIIHEVNRGH